MSKVDATGSQSKADTFSLNAAPQNRFGHWVENTALARGAILVVLWTLYLGAVQLGLALLFPNPPLAFIWPAGGIVAGGLAIVLPRDRPKLLTGVFLLLFLTNISRGYSPPTSAAFGLASVFEGVVFIAVYVARHWAPELRSPKQIVRFIGASAAASALGGVFAALTLTATGARFEIGVGLWVRWFMAHLVGIIAIAPPFLVLNMSPWHRRIDKEAALAIACGGLLSAVIFLTPVEGAEPAQYLPASLVFPVLFWCGARCSPLANALLALIVSVIIMYSIGQGLGPFSRLGWSANRSVFAVQNFVLVVCAGSLLLSILFTERREREAQLASALDAQKALLYEVNHRVKNSLQLVTSILIIEATKLKDSRARAALKSAQSRIDIIAALHRRLYSSDRHAVVDLGEALQDTAASVLRAAGRKDVTLVTAIEAGILVDISVAAPISLALSEIVTNSVKHAYRENGGHIHLELATVGESFRLKVRDDGPGFPNVAIGISGDSIGLRTITELIRQVSGVIDNGPSGTGASYTIDIPHPIPKARVGKK